MRPFSADQAAASAGRNIAVLIMALACGEPAGAGVTRAAELKIAVTGVRNDKGWIYLCVFDSERGFPDCSGKPAVTRRRAPASQGTVRFNVEIPPGLHAVSVLHDENGNGRLDTNFLGMPREGGGVSNNPPPRMGPPRFADAAFRLAPTGGQIVIRMVYP